MIHLWLATSAFYSAAPLPACRSPRIRVVRLDHGDIEVLSWRELQRACVAEGLPARGKAVELRERLRQVEALRRDSRTMRDREERRERDRFDAAAGAIEVLQQEARAEQAQLAAELRQLEEAPEEEPPPRAELRSDAAARRFEDLKARGEAEVRRREQRRRLLSEGGARVSQGAERRRRLSAGTAARPEEAGGVEEEAVGGRDRLLPAEATEEEVSAAQTLSPAVGSAGGLADGVAGVVSCLGNASDSLPRYCEQYESVWAAAAANSAAQPSPRMLNTRIASAPSAREVLRLHAEFGSTFNEEGVVARLFQREPALLAPLRLQTTGSLLLLRRRWGARAVASTAHSLALLSDAIGMVANVAWAFAAADHRTAPALFDEGFGRHVESLGGGFNDGSLVQLHQWALWLERECGRADGLPSEQLRARFHAAFASRGGRPSRLHKEVLSALASLRLEPAEHLQTDEGYTLDLVVEWRGERAAVVVAVMVDAPWHFHNRQPTGHTLLRRRQLRHFGWRVLPLPHWEWSTLYHSAVADDAPPQRRMQTYLLYALEQRVI
ncbi:hypothetical protein EMIHUDRAFT_214854 [Emiliania huxleyi CCMP1516]|uniref:RAP domain-containing protein n=2 Tax=Emiliania huxleyi TaxID=2903 RepID=A0A0D3III4_EMIH1|nr:hypothetical protein EMIHUDRAFT_214854 [Emiliania huxleyi CCMP1516]EOD11069.1 hypothetical protein EMIHUDRAFT_214854 [Emiliania huxleyi CCMP1516]|eukprot:XP_005763498.1 hypothetical protein EMIHUDRAFT_214854 [Emiliania huxleyi CCMP1516]